MCRRLDSVTQTPNHAFNIFLNLLWCATPHLVASKPWSQASLEQTVLVAHWLGMMWVGVRWLEALCVTGRRWACWRGTSISSPRWPCQRSCLLSSMVRHSLSSALPLWSLSDLAYQENQTVLPLPKHSLDLISLTWKLFPLLLVNHSLSKPFKLKHKYMCSVQSCLLVC